MKESKYIKIVDEVTKFFESKKDKHYEEVYNVWIDIVSNNEEYIYDVLNIKVD